MWLENVHSLTSTVENQSLATDIPLYLSGGTRTLMGGGRSRGGILGGGCAPPQIKMNFHQKMVGILVHSMMTFYVYAKIGQVYGGHPPPPPGSATAIFHKWLKIDGYIKLRGV